MTIDGRSVLQKYRIALFAAAALLTMALTACSPTPPAPKTSTVPQSSDWSKA